MRRFASAFWLALALLMGQHAALVHALGHATEQLSRKDSKPAHPSCDQCSACAELSNAIGAAPLVFASPALDHALPLAPLAAGIASAPRLAYRSQAPPHLL